MAQWQARELADAQAAGEPFRVAPEAVEALCEADAPRPRAREVGTGRPVHASAGEPEVVSLKLIAERPRSTQELAPLVGISEAGLSKHLRQLADAGLVSTRRDGYYVLYSLVPERIEPLTEAVRRFLGGQAGETGS